MLVTNYATIRPNELGTRTVEDFSKFLGSKPHRLGIVARQNPDLTTSFLTESLMNIYDVESKNKYQPISSFLIEWEVEQSFIKRVKFSTVPSSTGKWGAPVTFVFDEAYFGKYDTFRIERTRQQGIIVSNARRVSDKSFEYQVQLVTNNEDEEFDLTGCQAGMSVRWIGTAHPEMSEEGNVKSQSNMEVHRNYITRHRADVEYSSDFEAMEEVYITLGKSDSDTGTVYKMMKKEQQLLETFMIGRNQMNLMSKCNIDKNGKARNYDPATNRPKYMIIKLLSA